MIRTKGNVFEGKLLKFFYVTSRDKPVPLLVAVNVNKRHGIAVRRNRIKRRIRESLRLSIHERYKELKPHRTYFSVVIVYKGMKGQLPGSIRFADIKRDITEFMEAIHFSNARN